ncbi:MAG: LuxR C-terminal-related transcriptional regulator, partial [Sinobacterium sp.]
MNIQSPLRFRSDLNRLITGLVPVDSVRFNIYTYTEIPGDDETLQGDNLVSDHYADELWEDDPLHPSNFEGSDTRVIANTQLMSQEEWCKTRVYKEFYKPNRYFHNADMFVRKHGQIAAVLGLLRRDPESPFSTRDIELLSQVQPFVEYAVCSLYLPKQAIDRKLLAQRYKFTARELSVVNMAMTGMSNKLLAENLKIGMPTLRTHMQSIFVKVGV